MADIKHFLQSQKNKEGDKNLYDHISNILRKVLLENPKNAYDVFENFSQEIKDPNNQKRGEHEFDSRPRTREDYGEIKDWAEKTRGVLDKLVGEENKPLEGPVAYVPNLNEEMRKFELAGVSFSEQELCLLQSSLAKLAYEQKGTKSVRLWGKILGSEKDYWIAEVDQEGAVPDGVEDPQEVKDLEARGSGINQYNYYASNDFIFGDWKPLPVITPQQLTASRNVKHIFTGNLKADIVQNPPYPWKEEYLLRAQIARISHTTNIVPRGLWKIEAEDDATPEARLEARGITEEGEETLKQPTVEELAHLGNWVHYAPAILKEGRVTYSEVPDTIVEEKKEKWELDRKKRDPYEYRLKELTKDKALTGYKSAWSVKFVGDTINYDTQTFKKEKVNYGVTVVKSLIWPGSVTVAYVVQGKKWQNIYVGYGFKNSVKAYFPILTQLVQNEPNELPEQYEPQGKLPEQVDQNNQQQNNDD